MDDGAKPSRLLQLWQQCCLSPHHLLPLPTLPLLAAWCVGSLPVTLVTIDYAQVTRAVVVGLVAVGLAWLLFRRVTRGMVIAALLGFSLSLLHHHAPWRTYRPVMIAEQAYVEIEGVIVEHQLPWADDLHWVSDETRVKVSLQRLRLSRHEPWQACRGTILMRAREEQLALLDQRLRYGQTIHATGALQQPNVATFPGAFDQRAHLRIMGIEHVLHPESLRQIDLHPRGLRRLNAAFFGVRERLLKAVISDQSQESHRAILAAMTLGYRGGLSHADRDLYVRSGLVHLFAISGLHVANLFLILNVLLMLLRIPFRWRYLLAPILLLMYVLATGAAPSAMRAWMMLSIWSLGRAYMLPVVPSNAVLSAALLLLVYNPLYLFQAGFQFSFTIVLALIWGWQQGGLVLRYLFEKGIWIPARAVGGFRWHSWLARWSVKAVLSMVAAWLGGIGLVAWYNQLFLPMTVITNTFICLLALAIIFLVVAKLALLALIPWGASALVAMLLAGLLYLLRALAIAGADFGAVTLLPKPHLATIGIYYLLLIGLLLARRRLRLMWCMGGLLALFVAWMVVIPRLPSPSPRVHLLLPAGEHVPVLVIQYPYRTAPVLVNTGSGRFGYTLATWLKLQGVSELDRVVLLGTTVATGGGMATLVGTTRPRAIHVISETRRSLDRSRQQAWQAQAPWWHHHQQARIELPGMRVEPQRDATAETYQIQLHCPGGWRAEITLRMEPGHGCTVSYGEHWQGQEHSRQEHFLYGSSHQVVDLRTEPAQASAGPSYR